MVYTGTITTEAEIEIMAGEDVATAGDTEANRNLLVAQAEGFLSGVVQDDVKTGFTGYDDVTKQLLSEYASRYTGMALLQFQPLGQTGTKNRVQFEDEVNIHVFRMKLIRKELQNGEVLRQIKVNN